MSSQIVRIMGFPGQYVQGPGAIQQLGALLRKSGWQRPIVICDAIVAERVWPQTADGLKSAGLDANVLLFPGECTSSVIHTLANQARQADPDVIVGLGGGKAVDAAKGVALALDAPIVVCPTIASNDAPTSRLIVLYDDAHRLAGVEYMRSNPAAVVVDTSIIVQAPARFFAAGIGDAISKRFEAEQCHASGRNNAFGTPPLTTALTMARATYETLITYGVAAYRAVQNRELNEAVERVAEATVLLSGVGFESGGLSLAHALTRGFSMVPAMAATLHGEQVAFGALVQLIVEERTQAEIVELLELLCAVNLPVTLSQLGIAHEEVAQSASLIASATLSGPAGSLISPALSQTRLEAALLRADALGATALLRSNDTIA